MNNQTIEPFHVIGISVRTTNENGQAMQDIPQLWNQFIAEGISVKIPNKTGDAIYCVYTDYEKDHTQPYSTIVGCKVADLNDIPEGMVGKTIASANYSKHCAQGSILQGMVINEWIKIWNSNLDRAFTADFEVYDERSRNPDDAEVDIFIAVNNTK